VAQSSATSATGIQPLNDASEMTEQITEGLAGIEKNLEALMMDGDDTQLSTDSSSSSNGIATNCCVYDRVFLLFVQHKLALDGMKALACPRMQPQHMLKDLVDVKSIKWIRTLFPYKQTSVKRGRYPELSMSDGNIYTASRCTPVSSVNFLCF